MLHKAQSFFDRHIFSDQLPLGRRIFNLVAGFGLLATLAAVILGILAEAPWHNIFISCSMLAILVAFLIYCNIYKKYEFAMPLVLIATCNIIFPLLFFTGGGMGSGMSGYFVLSLVLTVLLTHGRTCLYLLMLNISVIIACYAADYNFPGLHTPASSNLMRHLDSVYGYLIPGLFIGALIKFQTKIHIEEKRKAQAASEAKAAFLASVSHVIRTPLNAIMGFSSLQLRQDLQEETRDNLEKIYSSGHTLLSIINDILDISRIESGNFMLDPADYDVASSINDTIALNIVRIGSKNINFVLDIDEDLPSVLRGDELRVKQILNNILSNAFKYTSEGEVHLKIECERDRKLAWLTFSVTDTGIGIREEDMARLFSNFRQFNLTGSTRREGTGLGLSIAKNLTEMMGGAIMVHSEHGKGSSFNVILPQDIVDPKPLGHEVAESLARRRFSSPRGSEITDLYCHQMPYARVLIVDDVEINLMVAESLITPYGITVDCVKSGKEAVQLVHEGKIIYDAIFMDHMMPDMDGLEAVRVIREEIGTSYSASVPIIALTANALVGNEEMFMASGFQAFLPKPIDALRLDEVLNTWVRKKELEKAGGADEQNP